MPQAKEPGGSPHAHRTAKQRRESESSQWRVRGESRRTEKAATRERGRQRKQRREQKGHRASARASAGAPTVAADAASWVMAEDWTDHAVSGGAM